ncbi:MAG TPA: respiratory nitrate reductase subunit gamma [Gallionella sp.]|nr:respiratory nitrate reductase subunit gamma [Gallionella sp.]
MSHLELLTFARGPALNWALILFVAGILLRLFEIFGLGRKADLAAPRRVTPGSGWHTMFARSLPPEGMLRREPVTYLAGYVFHIGLFVALILFAPHIELFRSLTGLHWPGLPTPLVDASVVAAIVALLVQLANRISSPVKRMLSTAGDYIAWAATLLPLLTGYLAYHHLLLEYTLMLALHIFSAEFLLIVLPFTKLVHMFSLFISRWYNGSAFARRGVAS